MIYEKYNKPKKHFNTATGKWDEIIGHETGNNGLTYNQLKLLGRLPGMKTKVFSDLTEEEQELFNGERNNFFPKKSKSELNN